MVGPSLQPPARECGASLFGDPPGQGGVRVQGSGVVIKLLKTSNES